MIQKPRQLIQEARESDHVVCVFRVVDNQEVAGVLEAGPGGAVGVSVTGEIFTTNPTIFSEAEELTASSKTAAILVLERPTDRAQALSAQDAGVQTFFLSSDQFELASELKRRGAWVGALLSKTALADAKQAVTARVDGIVCTPARTKGAFTGQEYILFEQLGSLMQAVPQVAVYLQGVSQVADEHLQKVSDTAVAGLIFDKPSDSAMSREAMKAFVVNKRAVSQREILLS